MRDAFISGLFSPLIRQRLLENHKLDLQTAISQARAMASAQLNADIYNVTSTPIGVNTIKSTTSPEPVSPTHSSPTLAVAKTAPCYFCGNSRHPRSQCPARNAICRNCQKQGHFAKVCKSTRSTPTHSNAVILASAIQSTIDILHKSTVTVFVSDKRFNALVDSGSSDNFIKLSVVRKLGLTFTQAHCGITLASSAKAIVLGFCRLDVTIANNQYSGTKFLVLENLFCNILLGHSFLRLHKSVSITFGGHLPEFATCNLTCMQVEPPSLFTNLSPSCKPVAMPSGSG